jgi:hypothetical protein
MRAKEGVAWIAASKCMVWEEEWANATATLFISIAGLANGLGHPTVRSNVERWVLPRQNTKFIA